MSEEHQNPYFGSSLDDFLREKGIYDEAVQEAHERVQEYEQAGIHISYDPEDNSIVLDFSDADPEKFTPEQKRLAMATARAVHRQQRRHKLGTALLYSFLFTNLALNLGYLFCLMVGIQLPILGIALSITNTLSGALAALLLWAVANILDGWKKQTVRVMAVVFFFLACFTCGMSVLYDIGQLGK